jgi:hypothetical protein
MSQGAAAAAAAAPPRRKVIAVVGDNCLDAAALEPGLAAGDEQQKQQLAEEVRAVLCGCQVAAVIMALLHSWSSGTA